MNVEITDQGKDAIDLYLKRCPGGVKIMAKTSPAVEEFFKHWAADEHRDVALYGRSWTSTAEDGKLRAWNMPTTAALDGTGFGFNLMQVGGPIFDQNGFINISFLRLCGISGERGAEFILEAVMSREHLTKITNMLQEGCARFYKQFIEDIDVHISLNFGERK